MHHKHKHYIAVSNIYEVFQQSLPFCTCCKLPVHIYAHQCNYCMSFMKADIMSKR